tara:strand:+ start:1371 stop:1973 length:603 start_codon:yes stop_codon:yes gene_type:complete
MEFTKELQEEIYDKYNVYYNDCQQAWTREQGKWNRKDFELGIITELITGDNILEKGESYVDYQEHTEPGHVCVCGCPMCTTLYRLYHRETDICFLVGSVCISKAGHPDFLKNLTCGQKNGFCKKCKNPLIFRGHRKNSEKSYKGVCKSCRTYGRIYLNIPYRDKDKYKKYGTRWESDLKLWYWIGYEDKLPDALEGLKIP